MNISLLYRSEKDTLYGSRILRTIKEPTESQSSSSGIFPRTHTTLELLHEIQIKMTKKRNQTRKISEIGSSSCRCTMASIGRKVKKTSRNVFRTLRKSRLTQTDMVFLDPGTEENGMEHTGTSPKESGTDQQK